MIEVFLFGFILYILFALLLSLIHFLTEPRIQWRMPWQKRLVYPKNRVFGKPWGDHIKGNHSHCDPSKCRHARQTNH